MKNIFLLLASMFLLVGCVESIALLGSTAGGAANGNLLSSSIQSAASYGIKQTTGKTPMGHALAYAKEINPEKKKERCISSIEKTNSEICMIVKKQLSSSKNSLKKKIASTQTTFKEKAKVVLGKTIKVKDENSNLNISNKPPRDLALKKTSEVKSETDNLVNIKNSTMKFVVEIKSKIKEYDARWLNSRTVQARNLRPY